MSCISPVPDIVSVYCNISHNTPIKTTNIHESIDSLFVLHKVFNNALKLNAHKKSTK